VNKAVHPVVDDHNIVSVQPLQGSGAMLLILTVDDLGGQTSASVNRTRRRSFHVLEGRPPRNRHQRTRFRAIGRPELRISGIRQGQSKGRLVNYMSPDSPDEPELFHDAAECPAAKWSKVEEKIAHNHTPGAIALMRPLRLRPFLP